MFIKAINVHIKRVLVIITDIDFDHLTGPGYSRIINYSKALKSLSTRVVLLSVRYDYCKNPFIRKEKYCDLFISAEKLTWKSTFDDFHFLKIKRFFYNSLEQLLARENGSTDYVFLLYNSTLPSVWFSFFYIKRRLRHKIFVEKNEFATAIAINRLTLADTFIKRVVLTLFKPVGIIAGLITDLFAVWFDGIIVISTGFESIYSRFNKRVVRIPILSDLFVRMEEIDTGDSDIFKLGYFGWLSEKKDGLFSLIDAMITLNAKSSTIVVLNIFGSGTKMTLNKLNEICSQYSFIRFHGSIKHSEVVRRLTENHLLAFPRPLNLQTRYGFSTKLAEFMMSGVPVLTTDVSDNSIYLMDGTNGFLIKGSRRINKTLLAEKLYSITSMDRQCLRKIGLAGRQTAINSFSPYIYSERLSDIF